MVCTLYVLRSNKSPRFYIGVTEVIETRVLKHNAGDVRSTKAYRPWALVYQETFSTKKEARQRELQLKNNYQIRKKLFEKIIRVQPGLLASSSSLA